MGLFFSTSMTIVVLVMALNASLLVGLFLIGEENDELKEFFIFLPEGIRDINFTDQDSIDYNQVKLLEEAPQDQPKGDFITSIVLTVTDFVSGIVDWFTAVLNFVYFIFYGFLVIMKALNFPVSLQFIIGVPLAILQTAAIFFIIIFYISSVRGGAV